MLHSLLTGVWLEKQIQCLNFPASIGYVIKMLSNPFGKETELSPLLIRRAIAFLKLEEIINNQTM